MLELRRVVRIHATAFTRLLGGLLAAVAVGHASPVRADVVDLPRHPSISPDGRTVVFSWRGSLWRAPMEGGLAVRLTAAGGNDLMSAWTPDGGRIVFTSDRLGVRNLFAMGSDGTGTRQLTDLDRPVTLAGTGTLPGGRVVATFDATLEGDVYRERRPYMVDLDGGPPARIHDAFGAEPRFSRDGAHLVFSRGGYYDAWRRRHYRGAEAADVWIHDRGADAFRRLTTFDGNDGYARWAGERTILFLSDRDHRTVNLFRMSAIEGDAVIARVTDQGNGENILDFDVSLDGRTAVLLIRDTLYRLDLARVDAMPEALAIHAGDDEVTRETLRQIERDVTAAALSPDGKTLALIAYGRLYVRAVEDGSPTRRIDAAAGTAAGHGRITDLAWSPDGLVLYFTSDEDGTESIYAARVAQTRTELRDAFRTAGRPAEAPAGEDGAPATAPEPEPMPEPMPEPDPDPAGAAPAAATDPGDGAPGDAPAPPAGEEAKTKKAKSLPPELDPARWQDAMVFRVEPLVQRPTDDRAPSPSPCGRMLAFRGVRGQLNIMDLESREIRVLRDGWDASLHWSWSPDARWIAFCENDLDFNADIFLVPADGASAPVNISRHPDNESSPRWSADGKMLVFLSDRINDEMDVWMVYLDRDIDAMDERDRKAYHDEAARAAPKRTPLPTDPDARAKALADLPKPAFEPAHLDDAWLRLRRVTSYLGSEGNLAVTPGGDRIIFSGSDRMAGLHSIKWDGSDLRSLGAAGAVQHVAFSGDRVVLVSAGQAATVKPDGGDRRTIGISDTLRIDRAAQAAQKFREIARGLGENYYHNDLHGVDWPRLTGQYMELAVRARTTDEFNWVANQFIGELGGSHLGVRGGPSDVPGASGDRHARLGTIHRPVDGGFLVESVIPFSPAAMGPLALAAGDLITAVDFTPIRPGDTLEAMLKGRAGRETAIGIRRTVDGAVRDLTTLLVPITFMRESQLRYEAWREENRRLVETWSEGRLGYIHIQAMSQPSLDLFERDLYAAGAGREGMILDVRNNGGGWTADRLLSSIMVRPHASTVPRGADPAARGHYPQDRLFIQRSLMPMNLVCNEKSYSNAEIISHAFRTLERGTLVGMPTHGSVISTGGWSLIDGTTVRRPFRGWYVEDGTGRDMELNGAVPHIIVPQTPEDEVGGTDRQLRTAVDDLLRRLPAR
ncbi:MAG: PD40 domain-containing protein [Phycisphaeraceae bacterium]|nr:PD40 domain-containing protein [Phycisphaeraceae bacterium]